MADGGQDMATPDEDGIEKLDVHTKWPNDALDQYLTPSANQSAGLKGFTFIGSGQSSPGTPQPLFERHDEALAEDFAR